jgi:energy-coupling factor transport system substrate-specific component
VKEIIRMWKYSTMVALTVLCAGIYMLFLLPFKSIPIIPGITEIRPATLFPVIFGLLFGPAGAWGSAIGNLCGDFFGTLSIGSAFGFIGNFLYAFIPYKLWYHIKLRHGEDRTPTINSPWKLAQFGIISFIASTACANIEVFLNQAFIDIDVSELKKEVLKRNLNILVYILL